MQQRTIYSTTKCQINFKVGDLKLQWKRKPSSCFVNNYFDGGLKAWKENMGEQTVFKENKAVTYMCQYFSKT